MLDKDYFPKSTHPANEDQRDANDDYGYRPLRLLRGMDDRIDAPSCSSSFRNLPPSIQATNQAASLSINLPEPMKQHAAQAAQQWQPTKYLKFENLRLRPALELLSRVPPLQSLLPGRSDAPTIVDLGAGSCNMGPAFLQRWPNANVTFVDTSASMLEKGEADHANNAELDASRFSYVQDSFESYAPASPVDLIYSNAALHWVDTERQAALLPKLMGCLKPGGVLAFQIPDTRQQPSHQLMLEAAKQLGFADQVANVRWVTCERDPSFYYELFKNVDQGIELDMWATIYAQVMDGENPVADFTSSTGLGPYLEQLGGRNETPAAIQFEQKYRDLIAQAYPKQKSDGRTIFNLKRFFVVAVKPLTVK